MRGLAAAGSGFLLAVLWMDLMFDVQVRGASSGRSPEDGLASIARYYARVTTAARPMNRLIALVMLTTVGALVGVIIRGELAVWRSWWALVLAVIAVGLAGARTVPNARRLGRRTDDVASQSRLARGILRDHVVCFAAIFAVLLLQLVPE